MNCGVGSWGPLSRVDGVLADLASPDVFDEDRLAEFEVVVGGDGRSGVHHLVRRRPQVPGDRLPAAGPTLGATPGVHPRQVVRIDVGMPGSHKFDEGDSRIPIATRRRCDLGLYIVVVA